MYVAKGKGGVNATLKKTNIGSWIMRFQTSIGVCKFEEFGWDMFLRKKFKRFNFF